MARRRTITSATFSPRSTARPSSVAEVSRDETVDGDHGRIETQEITVVHDVEWQQERHDWPGLRSIVVVESTREVGGKIDREMRLFAAWDDDFLASLIAA